MLFFFFSALVILIATISCYYPLLLRTEDGSLAYRAIRWDISDFTLPRLIYNSDSIRTGIFPLWNPYTYGGCPWVSNFQSFLFHPLNLFIIYIWGYSAEILQQQLFLIFFIAGVSMFLCARRFTASRSAALIAAISFLSCGFFVGNASHFGQINTLSLFPLCFLMTDKLVDTPNLHNLSGFAICFSLMIFSGYPTMVFFLGATCGIYGIIKIALKKNKRALIFLAGAFIVTLFLSSILLLPALESASYITRTKSLDITPEIVLKRSLSPFNFLTLPFPFLGLKNLASYNMDKTVRNSSIGIIGLCLAIYFILFNRTRIKWILTALLIGNIILSLGFNTPIYELAYNTRFPINILSHPAFAFRAGFLFFLALSAGMGANTFWKNYRDEKKKLLLSSIGLLSASLIILLSSGKVFRASEGKILFQHYEWLIIFGIFIALITLNLPKRLLFVALVILIISETAIWTRINFSTIAVTAPEGYWSKRTQKESARLRKVNHHDQLRRKHDFPDIKGGRSMFWKYFSDGGYDSTLLENFKSIMYSSAWKILSIDFRFIPIYQVEFFNDDKLVLQKINNGTNILKKALINHRDIEDENLLKRLEMLVGNKSGEDNFQGTITYYSPNLIKYDLDLADPAIIFFNEIYYPGWSLQERERNIPLFKINYAFRGAYLEKGEHQLSMKFQPVSYQAGMILSSLTALFCLGSILTYFKPGNR